MWPQARAYHRDIGDDAPPPRAKGKPRTKWRPSLIPSVGLRIVGAVMEFGAEKYVAHGWQNNHTYEEYVEALLRHAEVLRLGMQVGAPEVIDHESKLPHLAHIGACALIALSLGHFRTEDQK